MSARAPLLAGLLLAATAAAAAPGYYVVAPYDNAGTLTAKMEPPKANARSTSTGVRARTTASVVPGEAGCNQEAS